MKRWNNAARAVSLALALSLTLHTSAFADPTVNPLGTNTQNAADAAATGPSYASKLPAVTAVAATDQNTSGAAAGNTGQNQTNMDNSSASQGSTERPTVQAQGAVLYDATHNQFLFEQNADTRFYPASITKLMTALVVLERCGLDDEVTFSQSAVTNLESGAVTLKLAAGDKLSLKDCMYGLLLKSANEIANGLAEHVAGSVSAFADLMNQKARDLGCTNTNFVNPNGLNNTNHYTTPRDMALIAKAAFENPLLCQINSTVSYAFPATSQAPTVRNLTIGHKMLNPANTEYYYPGIVGGKTGYTSLAGNTLVTCAERNGVRMVAVILKSKQSHYTDTKALLDYGFALQTASAQGASTPGSGNSGNGPSGSGSSGNGPSGNGNFGSGPSGSGPSASGSGNSYPGGTGTNAGSPGGAAANGNRWEQDANGWRFIKADGGYAKNECMEINGELYCFKDDQYAVTNSWHSIDGIWYYFRPSGGLAKNRWVETNGYWYYVDANGSLMTNTTTPDGFLVDGNGVWVK